MRSPLTKSSMMAASLVFLMAFSYPVKSGLNVDQDKSASVEQCNMDNSVFQNGEELTYKLYYNWNFVWLSAGEVTFRVKDLGDKYYISATGQTYKSYDWFFKVRDSYEVWVDKQTLLPTTSIRDVHEGGYSVYDKLTFDHKRKKVTSLRGKTKEVAQPVEYDVESCLHDILSIVYFTRNVDFQDMRNGQDVPIKIFIDKKTWPLNMKYLGREADKKIKGLGKFNTLKLNPEVISGNVFKDGAEMTVWASDDENKIPLLIESPVSVGSVKVVLKSYKGLRHTLSSKKGDE